MTKLFSRGDAAAALRISLRKVDDLLASGRLNSVRIGRRRLVPAPALEEFVAALSAAPAAPRRRRPGRGRPGKPPIYKKNDKENGGDK